MQAAEILPKCRWASERVSASLSLFQVASSGLSAALQTGMQAVDEVGGLSVSSTQAQAFRMGSGSYFPFFCCGLIFFFCRLFVYCYTLTHSLTHCLSFFISFSSVTMREPMLLSSTGAHGGPGVGRSVQQGISRDFRGLTSSECTGIRWFSRRRLPWERSEKGFVLHCHALFILSFFMLACLLDLRSLSPFVLSCSRRGWSWGKGWREE